ncbi:zinc finger BED domain-containing protein 1-like, partial [Aphis craccivora]
VKYVSKFVNNNTMHIVIQEMVKTMSEELFKRFGDIQDNHLVTQAALLDPRLKKHVFSNSTKCANAISFLWTKVQIVNLIGGTSASVAGIIEVDKYLNEPLISRHENPLAWWVERKKVYPRTYELIKRRLCIIATSMPCERVFSRAGQVVTEKRNRLATNKISQILFLNHNIVKDTKDPLKKVYVNIHLENLLVSVV